MRSETAADADEDGARSSDGGASAEPASATTAVVPEAPGEPAAGEGPGTSPARDDAAGPPASEDLRRRGGELLARLPVDRLVQLLAIVPVLVMVGVVRESSNLQAGDYWTVFPRVVTADGALHPRQLFAFHEGHVLAVPATLWWLNLKLFDGVNRTLGAYVILVGLAQVAVLRSLLPKPPRISQWWFSGLVVAFAAFIFAPQGAHHFGRAMSGTAWLTSNLLSLVAMWFAYRRRPLAAIPVAALATICYGTGLVAWPAIVVISLLRSRWGWRLWVLMGSAVVAIGWYAVAYERPNSQASAVMDPNDVLHRTAQVLGTVVSGEAEVATLAGAIGLVAGVFLAAVAIKDRIGEAAPWIGLLIYAAGGALLIGGARGGINADGVGVSSRYTSSSALLWCALAALALLVTGPRLWLGLGAAMLAVVSYVGGQESLAAVHEYAIAQDARAIGLRIGAVPNRDPYLPYTGEPGLLEALGHYPFSSAFDLDCGLLDQSIDDQHVERLGEGMAGSMDETPAVAGGFAAPAVELSGWVVADKAPRCILFTDETGTVVGAGAYGIQRSDLLRVIGSPDGDFERGFRGPAGGPAESYRAYVALEGSDTFYRVPGVVPGAAASPSDEPAESSEPAS
jgi:hypothetical protein